MLERLAFGSLPEKHHTALRSPEGKLYYEECLTRDGFEGPYTLIYHQGRPQAFHAGPPAGPPLRTPPVPRGAIPDQLVRRHYRGFNQTEAKEGEAKPAGSASPTGVRGAGDVGPPTQSATPYSARLPLLFNSDLLLSVAQPDASDEAYVSNGDGDELIFILEGGGLLRSALGDLRFGQNDYLFLPRALPYRLLLESGPQRWFCMEFRRGLAIPQQWRNPAGQLRMDAPYCHRDFRQPDFRGPLDEGLRALLVKKNDRSHAFHFEDSPLDVVGWDGSVYPFVFPILKFQPRVGQVHLPPTWHGTFAGSGALVCSFVPRPLDFHPQAIPCPYPHSNVNVDEVIFYCSGNFTSRRGISPGSLSFHPAGVAHGPHPLAYERSIGTTHTKEMAVMLDVYQPLQATEFAVAIEDPNYQESFVD